MLTAKSAFETENASRYLQQMSKHFAHKIPVEYTETVSRAELKNGAVARMSAAGTTLELAVEAPDGEALDEAKSVIEVHLVRFAFREKLERLDWIDNGR